MPSGQAGERLGEVGGAVVDRGVEAEHLGQRPALLRPAGDADSTRPLQPGDLPDEGADRARCGRHHHGLAGLRAADVEKAGIGGHARHPEDAERQARRRHARVELAQALRARHRVVLPAAEGDDRLARREIRMLRGDDLAHGAADHHLADADGLGVGLRRAHAPAHVGVEGEPAVAQQHLALAGVGHTPLLHPEMRGVRLAVGARGQHDAAVDLCHGRPPVARSGGRQMERHRVLGHPCA